MSIVWQDLGGVSLTPGEIELHSDASQIASVSEPTFVMVIESRINKHSAALSLLIPWVAIAPVSQRIAGREEHGSEEMGEARGIERAMSAVPVTVRAEVAAIELPVEQILALQPGSVVRFGAQADEGVAVFAENVKLGRAHPGANGPRRAIQIHGTNRRQG
jgi:flagellar motor switch protein FliM